MIILTIMINLTKNEPLIVDGKSMKKGIYDILTNTRENYGNIKCYISENGMGVEGEERFVNDEGIIEDDYRIEFVKEHLKYVHQAIQEGTNCVGYHMWTCMDNWSWTNAYKNRYGFISVDLNNDAKCTIKKSGRWYKKKFLTITAFDSKHSEDCFTVFFIVKKWCCL